MPTNGENRFLNAVRVSDTAKTDLVRRMSAAGRYYHDFRHLEILWERHTRFLRDAELDLGAFDILIALAIAYHDVVYTGGAKDNEMLSAALWLEVSATDTDLDEEDRRWVAETILATADHLGTAAKIDATRPEGYARQWMLDLDLTPLGETSEIFDRNMDLLRAENPQADLVAGIRHYAAADKLYRCAPIAGAFERSARENLLRHLRHDVEKA